MRLRGPKLLICQPDSGKLPTCFGGKKVPITRANMSFWSRARPTAQHHLPAHEFSVIFTERALQRLKSRISKVRARRPLPTITEQLRQPIVAIRRGYRLREKCSRVHEIALYWGAYSR